MNTLFFIPMKFNCWFGDKCKEVEIIRPHGDRQPSYTILIDKYHKGRVWKVQDGSWRFDAPANVELIKDDFDAVIELIERTGF